MATKGHIGDLTAIVLRLASAPDGVTHQAIAEALSTTTARASARVGQLRKRGLIVSVKVHGTHAHHFTTQAAAEKWKQRQQKPRDVKPWPMSLPGTPTHIKPAPRMAPRPAESIAALSKSWTHDPRYQVGPGERVPPVFSSLGIGRYLAP